MQNPLENILLIFHDFVYTKKSFVNVDEHNFFVKQYFLLNPKARESPVSQLSLEQKMNKIESLAAKLQSIEWGE